MAKSWLRDFAWVKQAERKRRRPWLREGVTSAAHWKLLLPGFVALGWFTFATLPGRAATDSVNFDRDIRPILSENCFACHGPDEAKRKSGLRLDRREEAFKPAKSGDIAIVPKDPGKSALIARITSKDEDDRMPPPASGKKLTSHQIDLLRRWIEQGAPWQTHWAFVAPVRPEPAQVRNSKWVRNDIDRFVAARLEKEGLKPAPEADKTTLARRAALDLTGLPPTVEEVDGFLADGSPDAYEKLVDRLMTWPSFGEQQARYWLDAARYADTHGYHIDSRRDIWKYRDWVIQAFNDNKPFDQFTVEQLAGDLLPEPTMDQKIATGYVRANMTTGEGGVIEDEYRAKYTFDRVETTGAMYLGMTLLCCRCHSHKYDPIQQREYYGFYAFFNQLADPVMDENKPNPEPFLKVPSRAQSERTDWLKEHIEQAEHRIEKPAPELDEAQGAWQRDWATRLTRGWSALEPVRANSTKTNGAQLRIIEDKSVIAEGPNPDTDVHEMTFRLEAGNLGALRLEVMPADSLSQKSCGRAPDGTFLLSEFEAELGPPSKEGTETKPEKLTFVRAVADTEAKNHEIGRALDGRADTGWQIPTNGMSQAHAALFVPRQSIAVENGTELKVRLRYESDQPKAALSRFRISAAREQDLNALLHPPQFSSWQVLGPLKAGDALTALETPHGPEKQLDLKQKFPGVREEASWSERPEFQDGKAQLLVQDLHGVHGVRYLYRTLTVPSGGPLDVELRADGVFRLWINGELTGQRDHEETPGEGPLTIKAQLKPGENQFLWKIVTVQGASYFTFNPELGSADALTADIAAILAAAPQLTSANAEKVRTYYRRQHSPELRRAYDSVRRWRQEQEAIDRAVPTTLIAKDADKPRETVVLLRGEYDKKGEKVTPNVPAIFPPLPAGAPTNRLGLARWLLDPAHPLTARVTVNRIWQQYFGVGLVKTVEDFGVQGEHPSHPELLDWLATEFIRSGWDMKHMHRLILTSATYRQSSRASKELVARDPENRLLARGPRFRLDAEAMRDTALAVSGLLLPRTGGRSVRPYEPGGLWEAVSFNGSQKYVQDTGEAQYRRSMYTYWKRQSPPPAMLLFDAPTREFCTLRRSRSNTPLQALALLNDPQFVEASRAFGQRILLHGGDSPASRVEYAFRLATARQPTKDEVAVLCKMFEEQRATFQQDLPAADQFLGVGSFTARAGLDRADLAAWTTVASVLLNLDETITKN